jgi:eukaryotic-like serine/threonine-protein kinase
VSSEVPRVIGRYALHAEIASGGMAKVHLGRLVGPVGFARTVAIKRLHPHFASDPEFVAMFLDEARVAARIRHPNVVPILDVVALQGELFLVLEYVRGEALSRLLAVSAKKPDPIPAPIVTAIILGTLEGLHAAHEARSERGKPLEIVHRDVSPANVIVGDDGVPRVLDFGIAKASGRIQTTRDGQLKGKLAYMAPEQIDDARVDRRTDVWAASVVLWEMLARKRLFHTETHGATMRKILDEPIAPPSQRGAATDAFDEVVLRGLARNPDDRFPTARAMAIAIEAVLAPASPRMVGSWVEATAGAALLDRAAMVEDLESSSTTERPDPGDGAMTLNGRLAVALGADAALLQPPPPLLTETAEMPAALRPSQDAAPPVAVAPSPPPSLLSPPSPPPERRPPARRRRAGRVTLFAAGFLVFLVAFGAIRLLTRRASSPASVAEAPPTALAPRADAAGSAEPEPPTASTTTAGAASSVSTAFSTQKPGPRRRPSPHANCTPPYSVGPPPDFIRKPKPECFPN